MNMRVHESSEADVLPGRILRGSPVGATSAFDQERMWKRQVRLLIASTALVTPSIIMAAGALVGGTDGCLIALLVAAVVYTINLTNDHLVIHERMNGAATGATVLIRSLIPIAGTTLISLPVLLALFAHDIDKVLSERYRTRIAPIAREIAAQFDRDLNIPRTQLANAVVERADLQAKKKTLTDELAQEDLAARSEVQEAEATLRREQYHIACEADGSRCDETSTGVKGVGRSSRGASKRYTFAEKTRDAGQKTLQDLERRRQAELDPLNARLSVIDGGAGIPGSMAALQANLRDAIVFRDKIVEARTQSHPDVVAARTTAGPGARLLVLTEIVLAHPLLLSLVVAAKAFTTVLELLGVLRGLGYAASSSNGRATLEDASHANHLDVLARYRREAERVVAKCTVKRKRWSESQRFAAEKALDREGGLAALLHKLRSRH